MEEEEEEICEYDKIRQKNSAAKKALLDSLLTDCKAITSSLVGAEKKPKQRKKREPIVIAPSSPRPKRHIKRVVYFDDFKGVEEKDNISRKKSRVGVKKKVFAFRVSKGDPNANFLTPEDITDEMLEAVADRCIEKEYAKETGTSCHQCRQKTSDMKSICRSGHCVGTRGQFCGVCLLNRYGEKVRDVLLTPGWSCPPCRNVCNCSICRNRSGEGATGFAVRKAKVEGFGSVKEYLESQKKKEGGKKRQRKKKACVK